MREDTTPNECRRPVHGAARGFTMVEMAVTILLVGLLFAIGVPTFRNMSQTYALKNAAENMAARIRLYRDRAITTGIAQHIHFQPAVGRRPDAAGPQNWDYMVYPPNHDANSLVACWRLPNGITYLPGTLAWTDLYPSGRSLASGVIVLSDRRGNRDTVSVQLSGLVLTK